MYGVVPFVLWLDKFSQATSSVSVKCALAYMFSTNIINFSTSVHRTPIATHAAALRVYFVMWWGGVVIPWCTKGRFSVQLLLVLDFASCCA